MAVAQRLSCVPFAQLAGLALPFLASMPPRPLSFTCCNCLLLRDFQVELEAQALQRPQWD